jgi:hypothetical protein
MSDEQTKIAPLSEEGLRLSLPLTTGEGESLRRLMRPVRRDPVYEIASQLQRGEAIDRRQAERLLESACNLEAKRRRTRRLSAWLLSRMELPKTVQRSIALRVAGLIAVPLQEREIGVRERPFLIALAASTVIGLAAASFALPDQRDALLVFILTSIVSGLFTFLIAAATENRDKQVTREVIAESLGHMAVPASIEFITRALIFAQRDAMFSQRSKRSRALRSAATQILRAIPNHEPDPVVSEATSHLCWLAEQRDPELVIAALDAIAVAGDGYAMERVRKVSRKTHNQDVKVAANKALTALAARFPGERLLRPADRVPEELLRPASFSGADDPERLLRPLEESGESAINQAGTDTLHGK